MSHAVPHTIHIIGGGISSLSAAIHLSKQGCNISIYESSKNAGGRCRSFYDNVLNTTVDNGNHMILGANKHALEFINLIGAEKKFTKTTNSQFNFIDLQKEKKWQISNINTIYKSLPGNNISNILNLLKTLKSPKNKTIEEHLDNKLYNILWKPLAISIMNTPCEIASAEIFRRVIKIILKEGNEGLTTYIPQHNWNESIISPALQTLENYNNKKNSFEINYNSLVIKLAIDSNKIVKIITNKKEIPLGNNDIVVLAVPPYMAEKLLPNLSIPKNSHAIVNVHFRFPNEYDKQILGIIGGTADWLFFKKTDAEHIVSSTTSAADELAKLPDHEIAKLIWKDIVACLNIESFHMPLYRVIKEKRATFSCTDDNEKLRPNTVTDISNLFLAGDYTNTKLPATIDGAILSGKKAAKAIISKIQTN